MHFDANVKDRCCCWYGKVSKQLEGVRRQVGCLRVTGCVFVSDAVVSFYCLLAVDVFIIFNVFSLAQRLADDIMRRTIDSRGRYRARSSFALKTRNARYFKLIV